MLYVLGNVYISLDDSLFGLQLCIVISYNSPLYLYAISSNSFSFIYNFILSSSLYP